MWRIVISWRTYTFNQFGVCSGVSIQRMTLETDKGETVARAVAEGTLEALQKAGDIPRDSWFRLVCGECRNEGIYWDEETGRETHCSNCL